MFFAFLAVFVFPFPTFFPQYPGSFWLPCFYSIPFWLLAFLLLFLSILFIRSPFQAISPFFTNPLKICLQKKFSLFERPSIIIIIIIIIIIMIIIIIIMIIIIIII